MGFSIENTGICREGKNVKWKNLFAEIFNEKQNKSQLTDILIFLEREKKKKERNTVGIYPVFSAYISLEKSRQLFN